MSFYQRIQAILLGALIATTHISSQQQQPTRRRSHHQGEEGNDAIDDKQRQQQQHTAQISGSGVAGFLLAKGSDTKLNQSDGTDSLLGDLLARVGPDMRPMRDFRDFHDITPEVAKRAWLLMHDHAQLAVADRMQFMKPIIGQLLEQANVSRRCSADALSTIEAAKQLDSWAIQCKFCFRSAQSLVLSD